MKNAVVAVIFLLVNSLTTLGQETAQHLLKELQEATTDDQKFTTLDKLVEYYIPRNRDSVLYFNKKAKVYAKSSAENWSKYRFNEAESIYYDGDLELSGQIIDSILSFQKDQLDINLYNSVLLFKGRIEAKKNNLTESISIFQTIISYSESIKESDWTDDLRGTYLGALNGISHTLNKKEEYSSAIVYDLKSEPYHRKDSVGLDYSITLTNIGTNYMKTGQYQKAILYFKRADSVNYEKKLDYLYGIIDFKIAEVYYELEEIEIAKGYSDSSLARLNRHQNTLYPISEPYWLRGQIYVLQNEFKKGLTFCEKAFKSRYAETSLSLKMKSCDCIKDAYEGIGDLTKSIEFANKSIVLRDSIKDRLIKTKKEIWTINESITRRAIKDSLANEILISKANDQELLLDEINNNSFFKTIGLILLLTVLAVGYLFLRKTKSYSKKVSDSLNEKEWMLKEIHHRVKNNFQVISSLLNIQSNSIENKESIQQLNDAKNRIYSMSLVHQKLYEKDNFSKINTQEYFEELIEHISSSLFSRNNTTTTKVDCGDIVLPLETAVSLGLLSNELITNSVKYGKNENGITELNVKLQECKNEYNLLVSDTGKGFDNAAVSKSGSIGMELIEVLSEQIDGTFSFENRGGTIFSLRFPKK